MYESALKPIDFSPSPYCNNTGSLSEVYCPPTVARVRDEEYLS